MAVEIHIHIITDTAEEAMAEMSKLSDGGPTMVHAGCSGACANHKEIREVPIAQVDDSPDESSEEKETVEHVGDGAETAFNIPGFANPNREPGKSSPGNGRRTQAEMKEDKAYEAEQKDLGSGDEDHSEESTDAPDIDAVRAAAREASGRSGAEAVRKLMGDYGIEKLPDLEEKDYEAFIGACGELK